ncbi:hypothetical protein ACCO45_010279 [Purpureocillium lilacinum]|uniref:Uncharacterized protein n=1 Tax=Purpureocillium lilacinum TaxID=33203 RepID=A0ACC4DGX7_PURLI
MAADEEHEGASIKEQLIAACRGNNTDLLTELLDGKPDDEITSLLNRTVTVMGNHLYHEAASRGNYEVIDLLLDQPAFECDPPPPSGSFGLALVSMMLEAGSSPRARNRARLTPAQLYASQNAGDFADVVETSNPASNGTGAKSAAVLDAQASDDDDDDAEFSGSDDEERAEWERRRRSARHGSDLGGIHTCCCRTHPTRRCDRQADRAGRAAGAERR